MDYRRLSHQILDISLKVRVGDKVWIDGWDHTKKLISRLVGDCQERGCDVQGTLRSESSWLRSLKSGSASSLESLTPKQRAILGEIDHYIFTLGPRRPVDWRSIPQERRSLATIWLLEDNKFVEKWKSIAARRRVKMLGIEATLATKERAKVLGIDFGAYTESMYAGCLADSQQMARRAKKLAVVLQRKSSVRITTPTGTDLQFNLDNRPVEFSHGQVTDEESRNARPVFLPAGAVGTTVNEESAEGTIVYDSPIRRWNGTINRLKLRVENGRIMDYSASSGLSAFREYLDSGGADADRFAFIGFGLNPKLKLGYTQDDKVLGCIELNFGGNENRGGKNRGGTDIWGTLSGADVTIDGLNVMRSGKLLA